MAKNKGFTLIELSTTLAITSLLAVTGIPSLADFLQRQKIAAISTTLMSHLNFAREYAILNNAFVAICPTDNNLDCTKSWDNQFLVYVDENGNGERDRDESTTLKAVYIGKDWKLKWSAFGRKSQLTITPRGYTAHQNGSFYICPKSNAKVGRIIIVNKAARGRSAPDSNNNGFAEKNNGEDMTC